MDDRCKPKFPEVINFKGRPHFPPARSEADMKADIEGTANRILREKFAEEARVLVKTRFRHQGRTERGVDCLGLLVLAARRAGSRIVEEDVTDYPHRPDPEVLRRWLNRALCRIPRRQAASGDVFFMREGDLSAHVGVVDIDPDGKEHVIHAYGPAKQVLREVLQLDVRTILAVYRLPEEN